MTDPAPSNPAPPDYITSLRSLIGTRPVNLMGAVGLVLNGRGDLLLQRLAGRDVWGVPGGLCELGEPPLEAMRREVREETGLEVRGARLLDLLTTGHRQLPNGDEAYFYTAVYHVTDWHGTPVPDGVEGVEVAFFGPDDLPSLRGQPGAWAAEWLRARGPRATSPRP
ncbi:NUDIX domain-containing protein [Deinococcus sp. MIMF12]|uniref:NUDIX domain-containing protein n=1 Tax=Deinococcus rhizophilus TaxID=3049544 RepID=A0ABT7JK49_9DEIO|nr:NUDIX domain-containing protein [Deinococcus rhizophilus]MDL2344870.1 NUDIX domain-containing protein [Deinococcus rhizophilus]